MLFCTLEDLAYEIVHSIGGGDVKSFAGGMNVAKVGAEGNAIEAGELLNKEAALETCVDSYYAAILA